jgi:hypothetical protein
MLIEVLEPLKTRLVICPAINCWFDHPVVWKAALSIPIRKVILPLNHQEWRDTPTFSIDTSNRCSPFSIAWLNCLASATSICASYNHRWGNYTHHKARLVEVVEIGVNNPIFCPHILN